MKEFYKKVIVISILVCLLFTFFYVWPGIWRYKYYNYIREAITVIRVDRLTGEARPLF